MRQHTKKSKYSARRTKKQICNPESRKNRITDNSCFTPKAIQLLKRIYNHQNPKNKISKQGKVDDKGNIVSKGDDRYLSFIECLG